MARDNAVDEFVNCVIRRGDQDMILKPSLIIASLIAPFVFGIVLAIMIVFLHSDDVFPEEEFFECITVILFTAILIEFAVFSFMTFCLSRRNWNHLKRDLVWMDSLCNFVSNNGGDSSKMRGIKDQAKGYVLSKATKVSMAIWLIFITMLLAVGFILHLSDPVLEVSIVGISAWMVIFVFIGFIIALIQLVLTVGAIFGMPARHDKYQADFTEEFVRQAAKFGFRSEAMPHTVKRRKIWIHILLMIVTLGIYTFVYFVIACRDMNRHIHAQWKYEEKLTTEIIGFVGGSGIETTEDGMPSGIVRLINNLM